MNKQTEQELLKIVKRNYDSIAGSFAETRQKSIWPALAKLADLVKEGDNVLDVGCGSGRLFNLFKDRAINYLGLDNCQPLLDIAQDNFATSQNKPQFVQADVLELTNLPQVNFDYIFCVAMFHHLPSFRLRTQALRQLKNKMKPGGLLIITVWNLWTQNQYRRLIIKFWLLKLLKKNQMDFGDILFDWKDPKINTYNQRYYHAFTRKQLQNLAVEVGLNIKELYNDHYNYYLILQR
ncbi:MAG: putative Generic methyl-transferase/SAM [Candidatus Falkowbacteria bacterium GW2011_GWA2_39_24]|uniref:Putative Generic methyl-transferase/SAM n=1 Tax=Candidatus Falkowbacteria bacterium GW2011_GWA2_39_24 TaxID=1618634 RepID=A0A0G0ND17_9BACT|nr:MAG: putative Generic methyl-transferase/SAM [Candidatus Falkowbacteria bacterium GW2011_GWA2_39_24]